MLEDVAVLSPRALVEWHEADVHSLATSNEHGVTPLLVSSECAPGVDEYSQAVPKSSELIGSAQGGCARNAEVTELASALLDGSP